MGRTCAHQSPWRCPRANEAASKPRNRRSLRLPSFDQGKASLASLERMLKHLRVQCLYFGSSVPRRSCRRKERKQPFESWFDLPRYVPLVARFAFSPGTRQSLHCIILPSLWDVQLDRDSANVVDCKLGHASERGESASLERSVSEEFRFAT